MRVLIVLASLVALGLAQRPSGGWDDWRDWFNNNNQDYTIDYVHNYRFEDHEQTNGYHIIVAISDERQDRSCHIIEVGAEWEAYLQDEDLLYAVTEELYHLIDSHTAQETTLTPAELTEKYGDTDIMRECVNHIVYELVYAPSITTPRPTPAP